MMKRKIYTISLLLSFMVVLGHLMVPHHHHESSNVENSSKNILQAHSHHHNGTHHHDHESEEAENESDSKTDSGFPQHFHFSVTNDFDFIRLNKLSSNDVNLSNQNLISSQLFFCDLDEPPVIIAKGNFEQQRHFFTQYDPGANSLRGPPSIA